MEVSSPATKGAEDKAEIDAAARIVCVAQIIIAIPAILSFFLLLKNGIIQEDPIYSLFGVFGFYQLIAYAGVLHRKNWARKMALIYSYIFLLSIPIGTVFGLVIIKRFKNKEF